MPSSASVGPASSSWESHSSKRLNEKPLSRAGSLAELRVPGSSLGDEVDVVKRQLSSERRTAEDTWELRPYSWLGASSRAEVLARGKLWARWLGRLAQGSGQALVPWETSPSEESDS